MVNPVNSSVPEVSGKDLGHKKTPPNEVIKTEEVFQNMVKDQQNQDISLLKKDLAVNEVTSGSEYYIQQIMKDKGVSREVAKAEYEFFS